jgi:hypothetical protein
VLSLDTKEFASNEVERYSKRDMVHGNMLYSPNQSSLAGSIESASRSLTSGWTQKTLTNDDRKRIQYMHD